MAYLTLGDFAKRGLNRRPGQLGALSGGAEDHASALASINTQRDQMDALLSNLNSSAASARDQAFAAQDMAGQVSDPSAFSMSQDVQGAAQDVQARASEARQEVSTFDQAFRALEAKYANDRNWLRGTSGRILLTKAQAARNAVARINGDAQRAMAMLASSAGRLAALQRAASERTVQAAADLAERQRQQQQQQQFEYDRQAAEQERLRLQEEARISREDMARQAEAEFQRAQFEEQARRADQQREYEAQERARLAELEQRRLDAELRREQEAISAEGRRQRLTQEAALRAEEAAVRREEREAQLQQLMMIQELASAGLPVNMLPRGLPAPQAQAPFNPYQYTMPGFSPPPGSLAPGEWSPYGQVVQGPGGPAPTGFDPVAPGAALYPGGLPPYATQPAPAAYYSQSAAAPLAPSFMQPGMQAPYPQQPAQNAPPGFAWSGFDPGTEMFGMGGLGELRQTLNPNLKGALIEESWTMTGPEADGNYTLYRPGGQLFQRYTEDEIYQGTIRSETGNVVWVSPQTRPQSSTAAITADVAAILREAIKATGSVMTAQEQRKAQKYAARLPSASIPGDYDPAAVPASQSNALTIAAGVALAAGAFFGIGKLLGKKKK